MDAFRRDLIELGRAFYARGWSLATSSNYSVRVDERHFLITASGKDKGSLTESDFILMDLNGRPVEDSSARPSAETPVHAMLYRFLGEIASVLHVHSPYSTIVSMNGSSPIELSGYEMLKALKGVTNHLHVEMLPNFVNTQDMEALAKNVQEWLAPGAHGFLVGGHGLYTWGDSLAEARRHVEALEFLLECEYKRRLAGVK